MALGLVLNLLFVSVSISLAAGSRNDLFVGYSEKAGSVQSSGNRVVFQTTKGEFTVLMMRKNAPITTAAIEEMVRQGESCPGCRFYRNEAQMEVGSLGPPYGLLQGSMPSLDVVPPREGNKVARRGLACMIPATKEFFIALSDHSEWGTAHTVWGEVEDMTVVDRLVDAPFHMYTHPDYGTKMRMLNEEVPFEMKFSVAPKRW